MPDRAFFIISIVAMDSNPGKGFEPQQKGGQMDAGCTFGKKLPTDVKDLSPSQAKEIYKDMYWDNTKIPQIENERIQNAAFDMGVMSGPTISTKHCNKS